MSTERVLLRANDVIGAGLSPEVLSLCSDLIDSGHVSCDGLVLIVKEILNELE
ncbi:hypothetical protein NEHOM01_0766 [Nematocida homosporus]|uniref:uncharacterized protein n=1 Tax=Nematocida homosporus TaxID=1912981 RepID=UPI00221FDF0A|nr:uncharacterized protein NEHOM01_0766 [Nematocida homosporus]KAI5185351.1 hypothetical protein NEHOM01_0766 [Nematocida homosporus]